MKKIILILLCMVLLVSCFSGCTAKKEESNKLKIVCTVFPQYDFVRQIAGDLVELKMLVPTGTESHDFRLENMSVADIKAVAEADVIIYVGGAGDKFWIDELKHKVETKAEWLALCDMTEVLPELTSANMHHTHDHVEHSHDDHDHQEELDEHVWTSPKRAMDIVKYITEALCRLDTVNAKKYEQNRDKYLKELSELDEALSSITQKENCLIFADRFPFRYLCADYGFGFDAAFSGCSAVTDPSVAQINALCESAIEHNARAIFYLESSNVIYADGIADRVGARSVLLHSCHNVSRKEFESGATYVSLMKINIENISEALN